MKPIRELIIIRIKELCAASYYLQLVDLDQLSDYELLAKFERYIKSYYTQR